jgi:hypothetical protein
MGKNWGFIFATVDTIKQNFFLQQGHKKKTQIKLLSHKSNENKTEKSKYYLVASRKALFYSHMARFLPYCFKKGKCH